MTTTPEPSQAEQQQAEEAVDEVLVAYIASLLDSHDQFLEESPDDPMQQLGSILIIVDGGTIAERLTDACAAQRTLLLCLPTLEEAFEMDYRLAQWAMDYNTLEEVVMSLRPGHSCPEYEAYIANATEETSNVFIRAVVIPPESTMGKLLKEAVSIT